MLSDQNSPPRAAALLSPSPSPCSEREYFRVWHFHPRFLPPFNFRPSSHLQNPLRRLVGTTSNIEVYMQKAAQPPGSTPTCSVHGKRQNGVPAQQPSKQTCQPCSGCDFYRQLLMDKSAEPPKLVIKLNCAFCAKLCANISSANRHSFPQSIVHICRKPLGRLHRAQEGCAQMDADLSLTPLWQTL